MSVERITLRFLMTGGHTAIRSHFETLLQPEDLDAWLSNEFGVEVSSRADLTDLESAHTVRESTFNIIRARSRSQKPVALDFERLNHHARPAPMIPRFGSGGQRQWVSPAPVVAALSTVARDAVDLLGSPDAERTRECENPNCELVFVDVSPPGQRRWCAMGRCGNRAKTRAYRQRERGATSN